jgi:hypothetical protein
MGDTQPPLAYLFASSQDAAEAHFLSARNRIANLERTLVDLAEQWVQLRNDERIARSILSLRRARPDGRWLPLRAIVAERSDMCSPRSSQSSRTKVFALFSSACTDEVKRLQVPARRNSRRSVAGCHRPASKVVGPWPADSGCRGHAPMIPMYDHEPPLFMGHDRIFILHALYPSQERTPAREVSRRNRAALPPQHSRNPIETTARLRNGPCTRGRAFDDYTVPIRKKLLKADEFRSCAKTA